MTTHSSVELVATSLLKLFSDFVEARFAQLPINEQAEFYANLLIDRLVSARHNGPGSIQKKLLETRSDATRAGAANLVRRSADEEKLLRDGIQRSEAFFRSAAFQAEVTRVIEGRLANQNPPLDKLEQLFSEADASARLAVRFLPKDLATNEPALPDDLEWILKGIETACGIEVGREVEQEMEARFDSAFNAPVAIDDSAFIAAKTLREQRGINAANCNKFLAKHGTTSDQLVEGQVRYRKPNKKRLDIHSGD